MSAGKAAAEQTLAQRTEALEILQKAKVNADKGAEEHRVKADFWGRERAQLLANQDSLSKEKNSLSRQLQAKSRALDEFNEVVKATEAENQELTKRQQLMQEELLKAEAQIELIKDLLLREPGLS